MYSHWNRLSYDLNNYVDLGGCYAPSARHLHNSSDHTQLHLINVK